MSYILYGDGINYDTKVIRKLIDSGDRFVYLNFR
jgi:hypothetical protein